MSTTPLNLILADDDTDDCFFFKEAIEELPIAANLTIVNDGVQLMELLSAKKTLLPDAVFLDLNMPRKNGFECLAEIKINSELMNIPVIIYSTSLKAEVVELLYQKGAHLYICKPGEFDNLKEVILKALTIISENKQTNPARDKFMIQP